MTFLPVVERELRTASRRQPTYWFRFFTALTTVALCGWIWGWATDGMPPHERGQILFRVIAGLAFTFSILAGVGITADSLSEEKREGTLGLLFLTDLKGYDVVLGKLAATSLNALYSLLSVFPILAIPLLLGALTFGEFGRMALVLTNTLFFSLAAGMVVSSVCRRERQAMTATLLLIFFVTAGPPLIGLAIAWSDRTVPFNPAWLLSSAVHPAMLATDVLYRLNFRLFWLEVACTHVLAWSFLVLAAIIAPHAWQDRPTASSTASWRGRWRTWQFGHGPGGAAFRRGLLDLNPILWLAGRDRFRSLYVWEGLAGIGFVWLTLYGKYGVFFLDATVYFLTSYCAHAMIKLWVAAEACRPLSEDRQTGALELLLSTPLSVTEILEGEILALKRQFTWPVLVVLGADLVMLLAGMREEFLEASDDWVLLGLGMMVLFILDLYASAWVGLWLSLTAKRASRAMIATIAWVLVLPWAVFLLGLSLMAVLQVNFSPSELTLIVSGFTLAILNDVLLINWAGNNLRQHFRVMATKRFDTKKEEAPLAPLAAPAEAPPSISALGS